MTDCEKADEQTVFISCAYEVRYSFISHLSDALRRKGIDVFVDSDDLVSKEAQTKVEKARVSVVVLPGNTESLQKLLQVLAFWRNNDGQVVVPVLYGIGKVESGLRRRLQKISGLSQCHESREECSDSELVKEIVRDVYEKLFYMGRIGIYSKLLEIENMVCKQPMGTRYVGIWGMPGIGKTTLAKAVFDQMSGEFDACCFIEDYDRVIREKGLYRVLEEQFLKEKPVAGCTISKLSLLKDKLNNKRVLVVLDDVRNPLVAESFLGGFDWFCTESLIIITSRDKQVFRLCRVDQVYEVQGLNEKESLQLFSVCASMEGMGEQNLRELSMKVIEYANGNPLALSVYGRELKGKKTLSEMETAFLKLNRRPPSEIVDVVKSSYDTLSVSEKNIFLDIACFFRGENVDYVMQLLEGCDFFPHVGVDVLVDKCLVTVSENVVQMHNLIQDAGREIINGETIHIERRRRLWEPWSIKYLLEDNEHKTTFKRAQGTEDIEGMFLDTSNISFDVKPAAFENMFNLRLLKIYCSNPEMHPLIKFPKGFLHSLPNELRLLHWENYPLQYLPQKFDPMHLVEINMPYSQLQKLWGGTMNLEMLRTIRLCHSPQLVDVQDLLKAPNLEVIDLQGCARLQSFPATGQLMNLRVVNLSGCTEIKSFPEIPPNTETLHLQGTGITELPLSVVKPNYRELLNLLTDIPGLSGVSNLEQNDLERLTSLMKMSSSSQDPGKLICLDLKDCSRLRSLPNMVSLEFLKVLDLSGCSELETVQGFPRNLKELYIASTAVREVPQLPESLELLYAHGCVSLNSIPLDSEKLPMHYTFSNCYNLSPQVVNDFLVKVLGNVKHIPREHPQELNEALAFSFCAPSHANQDSTLDLQLGSSVMTQLNPSWRDTLVGFAMLVEVAFSEDYNDSEGFGISCVCRWRNKEGRSHRIERNFHCWAPGKVVPKVLKDHMFVFCDVNMRPSTDQGNDPDIWRDLVVFEFFPINQKTKRLDDSFTVTRCGVYVIAGDTSPKNTSPVLSLDQMEVSSSDEVEEILRVSYDGLQEMDKALFLYIACLFKDEDVDLVAPRFASIGLDVSSGLKVLANSSLIRVSSNGQIVMHFLLRNINIGTEILHRESVLPGRSKTLSGDFEMVSVASSSPGVGKMSSKGPQVLTRDFEKVFVASSSPGVRKISKGPQVFINFRGEEELREGFMTYLVHALREANINVFIDDQELRGRDLKNLFVRIEESKIALVILSEEYTSSKWCLDELVKIKKCMDKGSLIGIPIFYKLKPSAVRNLEGTFGDNFRELKCHIRRHSTRKWKEALTSISQAKGMHLSEESQSDRKFIRSIVQKVKMLLDSNPMGGKTGQKRQEVYSQCSMINARSIDITHSEKPEYWTWKSIYDPQKEVAIEVAVLNEVYWLDIRGTFHTRNLTPETKYEVVFVVKLGETASGWEEPVNLSLKLVMRDKSEYLREQTLCLEDYISDEWVDIRAGDFVAPPKLAAPAKIFFTMYQYDNTIRKTGLVVKGVAIRAVTAN